MLNIEANSAAPALRIAKSLEVLSDNVKSSGSSFTTIPSKNTLAATTTSNLAELDPRRNILEPTRYKLTSDGHKSKGILKKTLRGGQRRGRRVFDFRGTWIYPFDDSLAVVSTSACPSWTCFTTDVGIAACAA